MKWVVEREGEGASQARGITMKYVLIQDVLALESQESSLYNHFSYSLGWRSCAPKENIYFLIFHKAIWEMI